MDDTNFKELVHMVGAISKETNDTRGVVLAVTAMVTALARKQGLEEKEVQDLVLTLGDPDSMVQNDVRRRAGRTVSELFRVSNLSG